MLADPVIAGVVDLAPARAPAPSPVADESAMQAYAAVQSYLRPLRALLSDEVTEVAVNKPGEVWTESRSGWERHEVPALTYDHCRTLAKLIANSTQQSISEAHPICSASLPTGERVQAVIPPAVPSGTVSLTIRKPSRVRLTLEDYERNGAFGDVSTGIDEMPVERDLSKLLDERQIKEFLTLAVRSKQNIVISGAVGAGKTTIMKTLVDLIPSHERLVTIEDTPELDILHQPNHVRLFYSKDQRGVSQATPKMLLESGLRMKGDRYLLAELRSDEAFFFVRNVNSGHPGTITSVHATSPQLAIEQLMLLIKGSPEGNSLSREDIKQLLFMLVDVVVQFAVVDRVRRVTGIYYDPKRKRTLSAVG